MSTCLRPAVATTALQHATMPVMHTGFWRHKQCVAAATGRSQELYYVMPDGRDLEQQDTTSKPPILLDSLAGLLILHHARHMKLQWYISPGSDAASGLTSLCCRRAEPVDLAPAGQHVQLRLRKKEG